MQIETSDAVATQPVTPPSPQLQVLEETTQKHFYSVRIFAEIKEIKATLTNSSTPFWVELREPCDSKHFLFSVGFHFCFILPVFPRNKDAV